MILEKGNEFTVSPRFVSRTRVRSPDDVDADVEECHKEPQAWWLYFSRLELVECEYPP